MIRYQFKTKPYAHQRRALKKLLSLVRSGLYGGALLMDPRTGKTKTVIDFASILAQSGAITKVLVIAPPKPAIAVWPVEIMRHCPLLYEIIIWGDARSRKVPLTQPGPNTKIQFVILNYDAFGAPGRATKDANGRIVKRSKSVGGRYTIKKVIRKWVGTDMALCILDESHKIKAPGGRVANGVVSLAPLFRYRTILTGTPVTKAKRMFDVYMQWKFLNPDRFSHVPTSQEFKNEYGRWISIGAAGFPKWVGEKNVEDFRRRVHADSFAISRAECFDMPPPARRVELVPLVKSARLYDEMSKNMVAVLKNGQHIEASIALVQTLRLAQITSGIAKTPEGKLYRVGREKLSALESYLDEAKERDEKVIISARFRADIGSIARLAEQRFSLPVYQLKGGMKNRDVAQDLERFREFDGGAVYVVQPNAGSLGIDLSTAHRLVWYSLTPSWVDYSQMSDRIALNPNQTEIVYLLGENTVDEELLAALDDDGRVAKMVTRNPELLLRSTPGTISSRIGGNNIGKVVEL